MKKDYIKTKIFIRRNKRPKNSEQDADYIHHPTLIFFATLQNDKGADIDSRLRGNDK